MLEVLVGGFVNHCIVWDEDIHGEALLHRGHGVVVFSDGGQLVQLGGQLVEGHGSCPREVSILRLQVERLRDWPLG